MNFQELGLTLQREREKKGLNMEVVMEATKISRINLVALEKGDRSSLPHPVYTKGFVKSYARFLGLDADELSMIVDREYQSEGYDEDDIAYDVSPLAEKAFHENDVPADKKRSMWPALLVIVFLIGVIVVLVVNLNKNDEQQPVEPPASTEAVEETAPLPSEPVTPKPKEETPSLDGSDDTASTESDSAKPQANSKPAPIVEPKPEPKVEQKPAKTQAAKPEKQKYDHVLIIRATTDKGCWVGVWKGDEADMARDFVLKEGEPLRLMFNNPRRVRIGNASGVSVLYNGKPYLLDNAKGNIQTLRFGKN